MKKVGTLLILVFCFTGLLAQKVDSIKVEQSGNFIKIRYCILDSRPGELYRVNILCSINGGLNTELKSVSGDTGDHVPGGQREYWVVWDVLKDVDEIKTVDFIVRAELIRNNQAINYSEHNNVKLNTTGWDLKKFHFFLAIMQPGPKAGFKAGYMGNFGFALQFVNGKSLIREGGFTPIGEQFSAPNKLAVGIDISKRIVNNKGFQMHLLAGLQDTHTVYYDTKAPDNPWSMQDVKGIEFGFVFDYKRLAVSFSAVNFDPKQIEKKDSDLSVASPRTFLSSCIGLRF
jgi:hypothetical protein